MQATTLLRAGISLDPPVLYLAPPEERPFLEERRERMDALAQTTPGSTEEAHALNQLAEFHLAHGMAVEGLSILSGVTGPDLPPVHDLRAAALELALGLIDSRGRPLTDRASALLDPKYAGWPDQVLFLALARLRAGDMTGAGPMLEDAVTRLARFPKAVQEIVLPDLLESAIVTRQWRLARDLAAAFDGFPALKNGTAYHYLLGQAAEAGDESVAAFDSYARAMGGRDLWAHRARRALIDVSLAGKAMTTAEAVDLLSRESELWRGDARAARTLNDLATLQMAQGDTVGALETYGRLIAYGWAPEMVGEAKQKAHTLMDSLYEKGTGGQLSLGEFMQAHDRLSGYYRFDRHFSDAAERFADVFLAAGATTVAAREYAAIFDYQSVAVDLGLTEAEPDRMDKLRVKEAEAMLAGGQYEPLGTLLQQIVLPEDDALRKRLDVVAARYFSETGQQARIVEGGSAEPTPQFRRIRAQALFEMQDWARAEVAYAEIWAMEGDEMPFADAINFLLSAYRNGNMAQTAALAEEFPKLTTLPGWASIAAGLTETAPELLPLREETATARVRKANDTLETLPPVSETN
ncbi:hypothetical protein ATO6_20330 [Oceanicola sp. 22II-s10i]|nr:hypothetical protein ATO6_20330 [Oceanicola sp. 22II-s10i]